MTSFLGADRQKWLIGLFLCALAGWPASSELLNFAGATRATWLAFEVGASEASAGSPELSLENGDGSVKIRAPLSTPPASVNVVGIRPPAGVNLQVTKVEADGKSVAIPRKSIDYRWISGNAAESVAQFTVTTPGFFVLPAAARTLKITFERPAKDSTAGLSWRNETREVQLTAGAAGKEEVTLSAQPFDTAWMLLPATGIADLRIAITTDEKPLHLRAVVLYSDPVQTWSTPALEAGATQSSGCLLARQGDVIVLPSRSTCSFGLANLQPINQISILLRSASWCLTTILLLGCLGLVRAASEFVSGKTQTIRFVPTRFGIWTEKWTAGWSADRVALWVGTVALVFQVTYAQVMPAAYSPDSIDYYAYGRNFAHGIGLAGVETFRTPGYSIFIGGIIRLFGDQIAMIAFVQHLMLAALAPVVAILLYRISGPAVAAIAGLAAGICPLVTVLASYVWTEALFTVATTLALLFLVCLRPGARSGILVGVAIGLAVLIRPTGLVILAFALAWLFLIWWCGNGSVFRLFALPAVAMLIGYAVVVLPWYLEVHKREGTWSLATMTEFYGLEGRPAPGTVLHPAGQGTYGHWLLLLFHGRSPGTLEINRPYRTLMEHFDWHGGYTIARILPFELIADDRYPTEVIRESIRTLPGPWLRDAARLLKYNLFFVRDTDAHLVQPAEVSMTVNQLAAGNYPAAPPAENPNAALDAMNKYIEPAPRRDMAQQWSKLDELMKWMTFKWQPPSSWAVQALASTIHAVLSKWVLVSSVAVFATLLALWIPSLRAIAPIGVFWLGLGAAHSLFALAGERYMLVIEPLLYILIIVVAGNLTLRRPVFTDRT